jgi:hypothetical protein
MQSKGGCMCGAPANQQHEHLCYLGPYAWLEYVALNWLKHWRGARSAAQRTFTEELSDASTV